MLNRIPSLVVCLLTAASMAAFGQTTQYVFQLPSGAGARFQGFPYDTNVTTPPIDATGPVGATKVIPKPDGSKYYVCAGCGAPGFTGTGQIQSFSFSGGAATTLGGITGTPTEAAITPDGKYLAVGATGLFIVDTSTDSVVPNTTNLSTATIVGLVASRDSKTLWVLGNNAFQSTITAVDLTTLKSAGQLPLSFGGATSMTMSPDGLLYVAAPNVILEVDPASLTITPSGTIQPSNLTGTPGPFHYTPDGTTAYFINETSQSGGRSIYKLNLSTHALDSWPPYNPSMPAPQFDDVYVAGNGRVFAHSVCPSGPCNYDAVLWDVTPTPLSAAASALVSAFPTNDVLSVAVSNEVPSSRFLYALVANGNRTDLVRVDLSTNLAVGDELAILGAGTLKFVPVPAQTGAASFLVPSASTPQTVAAGMTSGPLIARLVDTTGRPVYNAPVSFAAGQSGVTIQNATQSTNADGYVSATATVPSTPGTYTVTLTTGGTSPVTATFTLTVAGSSGGGSGGGPTLVSIVSGNGGLFQAGAGLPLDAPLTVKVVDKTGAPTKNAVVTFQVVDGPVGNFNNGTTATDENGIATSGYTFPFPQTGLPFQASHITATATTSGGTFIGSVTFVETTYVLNNSLNFNDPTGRPEARLVAPQTYMITGGEGDVVSNAIVYSVHSTSGGQSLPIPNVGVEMVNALDPTMPAPASCQANALTDQNGSVSCNLTIGCSAGLTDIGIYASIGGGYRLDPLTLHVGQGSSRTITMNAGNNQSGHVGDTLPQALVATVTDNCGTPVTGATVTWQVTKGSATLSNTNNVSNSLGQVSTKVVFGQTQGPVQVAVSIGMSASAVFSLTSTVVVSSVTVTGGSGQTAITGAVFPQPITFQVKDANGNPVPGVQVNFSVTGSISVSPASATTNSQGVVSTTATAGGAPGSATVSGSYSTLKATATLTVNAAGPMLISTSFVNAASFQPGLVPCGLATAMGHGIAPNLQGVVSGASGFGPLPYTLTWGTGNSITMTINGTPVPLYNLVNMNGTEQVTFQTPCEVVPGTPATAVVQVNGGTTTVTGIQVFTAQPGMFTWLGPNNKPYGSVISAKDGSYVTPSNLARRGEMYYMVATGLGQVTPPTLTDAAGIGNQNVNLPVIIGVDNAGVPVISAQYLPGSIGEYVVEFQIPMDAPTGTDQPLAIAVTLNGQTVFGNPAYLPGVQ
jgi:uncharacterized protein (TIGR03437 family)